MWGNSGEIQSVPKKWGGGVFEGGGGSGEIERLQASCPPIGGGQPPSHMA